MASSIKPQRCLNRAVAFRIWLARYFSIWIHFHDASGIRFNFHNEKPPLSHWQWQPYLIRPSGCTAIMNTFLLLGGVEKRCILEPTWNTSPTTAAASSLAPIRSSSMKQIGCQPASPALSALNEARDRKDGPVNLFPISQEQPLSQPAHFNPPHY
jgi:hypothetical protein